MLGDTQDLFCIPSSEVDRKVFEVMPVDTQD